MSNWIGKLIDALKRSSIQFIITASFTFVTTLVMLFVGVVLYSKFARTAEQNAFLHTQQTIEQASYNLERYLAEMTKIFELVEENISKSPQAPDEKLVEQLETIVQTREDLVSLALFTPEGDLITGVPLKKLRKNTQLTHQSWFRSVIDNPKNRFFSLPHVQNLFKGQYPWVVSMSKGIAIRRNNGVHPAVLLMDVNFKTIDDLSRKVSLGKKGYVYIIDLVGNIVYHPQQQLIYVGLKNEDRALPLKYSYGSYVDDANGENRLITIKTVDSIGWKMIGVSYMDDLATTKQEISTFMFWLLIFVVVTVWFVLAYLSARISRPIKRLEQSMEQVEQGDFGVNLSIKGSHEVEQLSNRFNRMVARVRQLMAQIIREQEAKRRSELEVLQAQINPHFLYNTLNAVVRMVGIGKNEEVITMITSLSKLFRISLSRGKTVISVQEELEHVRHYLVIQQMRFKQKFEYEIEAEEAVRSCRTLKLLLQPIVENAIAHGIEQMVDPGWIQIRAAIVEGKVLFEVTDNGLGMPAYKVSQLLAGEQRSTNGSGVGLRNIQERIQLYYGQEYGVEIESEEETGTVVRIWIPCIKEEG